MDRFDVILQLPELQFHHLHNRGHILTELLSLFLKGLYKSITITDIQELPIVHTAVRYKPFYNPFIF
jgi:hypothetical protein